MSKQPPRRQRIRRGITLTAFLLFPVILNYFSPYVIIDGASQGIISGSFIVFVLLFLSALFLGRAWCGWVCPAGGMQDVAAGVNAGAFKTGKRDWIKWFIWTPWIGLVATAAIAAGGLRRVDFFHLTETGVSVTHPMQYIIYFMVVGVFVGLAVLAGRRAACHTICWMAPFMIVGRGLRNTLAWPSLRLVATPEACRNCLKCSSNCPMSLDTHEMVRSGQMEHRECILCGSCVDNCAQDAIRFSFSAGENKAKEIERIPAP